MLAIKLQEPYEAHLSAVRFQQHMNPKAVAYISTAEVTVHNSNLDLHFVNDLPKIFKKLYF